MPINHAITIPSANNKPAPVPSVLVNGTWQDDPSQTQTNPTPMLAADPGNTPPEYNHPWTCAFACTIPEHTDTVIMLYGDIVDTDGNPYLDDNGDPCGQFSLTPDEANDNNYGSVAFTYDPPLA